MKRCKDIFLSLLLVLIIIVSMFSIKTKAASIYKDYLMAKDLNSGLVYEPTLVLELEKLEDLNNDAKTYITSIIINIDKDMNVLVDNQKIYFSDFFDNNIKSKYIPIVRLNKQNVDAFIRYYKEEYTIYDLMIISDDLDVIGKVYQDEATYILNSVYDMQNIKLPSSRFAGWDYVASCNKVGCNILMANSEDENLTVFCEYVQAMSKVCWASGDNLFDNVKGLSSGCYGVVGINTNNLVNAISYFKKSGWTHPQYIAAHRGITKYCNENSLTSCLAAYSEGATHIEVDLQVLNDGNIVLCHNSQTNFNSDKNGWYFVNVTLDNIRKAKLNDYNINYNETYATLEELLKEMLKTDIIMIIELKFDNGSEVAVDTLKCIENFKRIMDSMPNAYGHFYAITFFAPLAEKMKELMPEIPLGYLGGARSGKETTTGEAAWSAGGGHKEIYDYANKIKFLRYYNIGLDESYVYANQSGEYFSNITANFYLARGYVQNTWTYEDTLHFAMKTSIATTNAAEECAYLIKHIDKSDLVLTKDELLSGKVKVKTYSYNGWIMEKECDVIIIEDNGSSAKVLLYYYQDGSTPYGLYSEIVNVSIN